MIGFIQRQMPTNYAQDFCIGLKCVNNGSNPTCMVLTLFDGTLFYSPELGVNYGILSLYEANPETMGPSSNQANQFNDSLKDYQVQKRAQLMEFEKELCQSLVDHQVTSFMSSFK